MDHLWVSTVLQDIAVYCEKNGLTETKRLTELACLVSEAECTASRPAKLSIEQHLEIVNNCPM